VDGPPEMMARNPRLASGGEVGGGGGGGGGGEKGGKISCLEEGVTIRQLTEYVLCANDVRWHDFCCFFVNVVCVGGKKSFLPRVQSSGIGAKCTASSN